MYLSDLAIRNSGPIDDLRLKFDTSKAGNPLPSLMVGITGPGKTNLLSIIVDALFEGAANAYQDIVPTEGFGRNWFRLIGSKTIKIGADGGFAIAKFRDGIDSYFYAEKGGLYQAASAQKEVGPSLSPAANWSAEGPYKSFQLPEKTAERVYAEGAYAYFPASRSEIPHWLNRAALPEQGFDTSGGISSRLDKPLFVERGLDKFAQWMMSVILDSRIDPSEVSRALSGASILTGQFSSAIAKRQLDTAAAAFKTWNAANEILRVITGRRSARFVWLGRQHAQKLSIADADTLMATGLDGLSGGQATLLNIFGTLIRYGDSGTGFMKSPEEIVGICVVDEIDAHMHVDLQIEVLPELIGMFPKVQFIVSGHSPFFMMGMERCFGKDGFRVIDMPSGNMLETENYEELGKALQHVRETKKFQAYIDQAVISMSKPKIWFEGETDPIYFKKAAELHGYNRLLEMAEFEWIGAKDQNTGQGFNTGKDALDKAHNLLLAKPNLVREHVVLVYDSDTKKANKDAGNVHVRVIEVNEVTKIAVKGVENLLPESVFTSEMYDETMRIKDYGGSIVTKELNKMRLCLSLCETARKEEFSRFVPTLRDLAKTIVT